MKIAEFFIALGIKGAPQVGKAIKGVRDGLSETKSMSLEAKAAIAGVIYGLERLMSQSAKNGTELLNFNSLTDLSARKLQQWQYAARQAGVDSQELTSNVKAVQNAMTNMLLGKGAPEGMAMLANKVGFDPKRARDTFYVLEQLQKFAKTVPADVGNAMLKSFGLSENIISSMRRNAFRPDVLGAAPTYSDKQINSLNKVDVAWSNLGNKIQMAFGQITARDGLRIVNEISKMTTEVLKLVDALVKLTDKMKVFQVIGKVFEGWSGIIGGLTESFEGVSRMGDFKNPTNPKEQGVGAWIKQAAKNDWESAKMNARYFMSQDARPEGPTKSDEFIINQTLNFQHDGKDSKQTSKDVNKAVRDAYRQMSAQGQGS